MQKIYKIYPTGAFAPTLENFGETAFYTTGKYYDYVGREEIFRCAEVLILGEPVEWEYGKFIPNRYFGKIKNVGMVEFYYCSKKDVIEIVNIVEVLRGDFPNEEELSRLKKCLYRQCSYQKQYNVWNTPTVNVYIQVYMPIAGESYQFFRQKLLYDGVYNFDENGAIMPDSMKKKYFQITKNILYDLEKHIFLKNGEEVLFSPYNARCKQQLLELLIMSSPSRVSKEKLLDVLHMDNKKLLEVKRSLLNFEFQKYL